MRPRRLDHHLYIGPQQYFLTICTFERRSHFVETATVTLVHDQFLRTAADFEFAILAYCYMPDHVHLLVEGTAQQSHLPSFVSLAKQRAAFLVKRTLQLRLWQQGYFERVLRDDDDAFNVARYVIQNPVRAGLVQSPGQYPFIGSSILTKEQLIGSCAWNPRERARSPWRRP
jgi:putative transposase